MTSRSPGSLDVVFHSKEDVVEHVYGLLESKGDPKPRGEEILGTEVEAFPYYTRGGDRFPITQDHTYDLFHRLYAAFEDQGKIAEIHFQPSPGRVVTSVSVDGLGAFSNEAGLQIEFASIPVLNAQRVFDLNTLALSTLRKVAAEMGYVLEFRGHADGWAKQTEGSQTSRGLGFTNQYRDVLGPAAAALVREYQHGTASLQATVDVYKADFVEKLKMGLIAGNLLALHFNNPESSRLKIMDQNYGLFFRERVKPIYDLWHAKDAEDALRIIVDRLMDVQVPMLPNPENAVSYSTVPVTNRFRTVRELMVRGQLSELNLNNVFGFMYGDPALRNIVKMLSEIRKVDSMGDPAKIAEFSGRVAKAFYEPEIRGEVLDWFKFMGLEEGRLEQLHIAAVNSNHGLKINGHFVGQMLDYFLEKTEPEPFINPTSARNRFSVVASKPALLTPILDGSDAGDVRPGTTTAVLETVVARGDTRIATGRGGAQLGSPGTESGRALSAAGTNFADEVRHHDERLHSNNDPFRRDSRARSRALDVAP